jgi:magnesium chelatase subunit H
VPNEDEIDSYLEAYFGDRMSAQHRAFAISKLHKKSEDFDLWAAISDFGSFLRDLVGVPTSDNTSSTGAVESALTEASEIASLLMRSSEEIESVLQGLDGGYIRPAPGGGTCSRCKLHVFADLCLLTRLSLSFLEDLLRDGPSVLPTGRNIHALDPYRMPSSSAWARGQRAAAEIIRQHKEKNNGAYPETVAVTLWGLDSIKTRGESVAIVLALVGAKPVREGTGRIVRYDLIPLAELGRPRIDVLASLSGIFRYVGTIEILYLP